jgi:hypothetical protein
VVDLPAEGLEELLERAELLGVARRQADLFAVRGSTPWLRVSSRTLGILNYPVRM